MPARRAVRPAEALAVLALTLAGAGHAAGLGAVPVAILGVGGALLGYGALLGRLRLRPASAAILLGALLVYLGYLSYTDPTERNYDGPAHLQVIAFIAQRHRLPPIDLNQIAHHPPLYYLIAAAVQVCCRLSGACPPVLGLQLLSLALCCCFGALSALILERVCPSPRAAALALALVALWPYAVIGSVRVSNDVLLYPLAAAAMLYLVRWHDDGRRRDLAVACAASALAVLTKVNGLALVALVLVVVLRRLWRSPRRRSGWRKLVLPLGAMALVAGGLMAERAVRAGGQLEQGLLGAAHQRDARRLLEAEPHSYLYLDVEDFLRRAFVIDRRLGWVRRGGRKGHLYWNQFVKSSLLGSHNVVDMLRSLEPDFHASKPLAQLMNATLLGMIAFVLASLARFWRRPLGLHPVLGAAALLIVGAALAFRMVEPAFHHADFRLAYPALVPLAALYAVATHRWRERGLLLGHAGEALGAVMLLSSVWYFAPTQQAVMGSEHPSGQSSSKSRLLSSPSLTGARRSSAPMAPMRPRIAPR